MRMQEKTGQKENNNSRNFDLNAQNKDTKSKQIKVTSF